MYIIGYDVKFTDCKTISYGCVNKDDHSPGNLVTALYKIVRG